MKPYRMILFLLFLPLFACSREEAVKPTAAARKPVNGPTTVFVRITGLAVFADQDVTPAMGKLKPLDLLILNARSAHHPHVPLLMYERTQSTGPQDKRATSSVLAKEYFELIGEELTFRGVENDELVYADTAVDCADLRKNSLKWIPRLSDIAKKSPDHNDLNGHFLTKTPDPSRLALRVELSHGQLIAKAKTPIVWEFNTKRGGADGTLQQPTAQEVFWKFEIPGESLIIDSRRFSPVGSQKKALLSIKADRNRQIHLTIANVIPKDINAVADPNTKKALDEIDPHYENYYTLVKGQPTKRIPIAFGFCDDGVPKKGDTKKIRCHMQDIIAFKNPINCDSVVQGTAGGVNCVPSRVP